MLNLALSGMDFACAMLRVGEVMKHKLELNLFWIELCVFLNGSDTEINQIPWLVPSILNYMSLHPDFGVIDFYDWSYSFSSGTSSLPLSTGEYRKDGKRCCRPACSHSLFIRWI